MTDIQTATCRASTSVVPGVRRTTATAPLERVLRIYAAGSRADGDDLAEIFGAAMASR
jgi:hypothetical protein